MHPHNEYTHFKATLKLMGWKSKSGTIDYAAPSNWVHPDGSITLRQANDMIYITENSKKGKSGIIHMFNNYKDALNKICEF